MAYTVKKLADIANVSVRTLHFYDEAGLLKPAKVRKNGYREYGERELLRLQQILFFRELDVPLSDIKRLIDAPDFDEAEALWRHRAQIVAKRERLGGLIRTIDRTINRLKGKEYMTDEDLYAGFSKEEAEAMKKEAKDRWGNTDAYRQSQERVKKMTKEDWTRVSKENDEIYRGLAAFVGTDPAGAETQALIARHYDGLRAFYEPSPEMYRGLGQMYVDDARFGAFFSRYHPGLSAFMRDAMMRYSDSISRK